MSGLKGNRGGKRKGAGRPKNRPTKAIRVPEEYAEFIKSGQMEDVLAVLLDYKYQAKDQPGNSPRYYKLNQLLEEIDQIVDIEGL